MVFPARPPRPPRLTLAASHSYFSYADPIGLKTGTGATCMNRTLLFQVLPTGPTLARGRVAVLDRFVHAERGQVRCPAAAALAADLGERLGRGAAVTRDEVVAGADGGSVTVCVSFLDRDGHAIGLAAAVRTCDYEAIDIVRQTMRSWAAAMRTRRVLIAERPDCMTGGCSHRRMAHASVLDFTHRGDTVVLIADRRGHDVGAVESEVESEVESAVTELVAAARHAGGSTVVVGDPGEVASLEAGLGAKIDPDALSFVIVPGIRIEAAMPILGRLREKFPRLRGQHPDEYCYAASDLHESVRSVAEASERLLVVAGSAREAVNMADVHGVPWHRVLGAADLRPAHLAAGTLGLIVGGGAGGATGRAWDEGAGVVDSALEPFDSFDPYDLLDALAGLGPLSVRRRGVRTAAYSRGVSGAVELPVADTVQA
jgi:4-hydroxy-3-methylbut-2-enyl diphosphate reductase